MTLLTVLGYLGITSIIGFLGQLIALESLPPELMAEGVVDKSKRLSSESRLKIRNAGKLAAYTVRAELQDVSFVWGSNTFSNGAIAGGPNLAPRLASGETTEISITPGIVFNGGAEVHSFSAILTLHYVAKIFFLKKGFSKKWKVELRNYRDGYAWNITILESHNTGMRWVT